MPALHNAHLPPGLLISGTGTGVGKTFVSRGLAAALASAGRRVVALKPIETGVPEASTRSAAAARSAPAAPSAPSAPAPRPLTDAEALARACDRPDLANAAGLYRAALPLSPYAVSLATGAAPPSIPALCSVIASLAQGAELLLVEGAGGLLVPLDRELAIADLAAALQLPVLLVAHDTLGVLSAVLTAAESAERRGLTLAAVVLTEHAPFSSEPSTTHNRAILQERLRCPVLAFARCPDDDLSLAAAARSCGLVAQLEALL